jgi:hypothetical protein
MRYFFKPFADNLHGGGITTFSTNKDRRCCEQQETGGPRLRNRARLAD